MPPSRRARWRTSRSTSPPPSSPSSSTGISRRATSYYAPRCFSNGFAARKVLENSLQSKAQADAEAVEQAVAAGAARADAVAPYVTDEAFGAWYQQFSDALNDAAAGKAGAAKN